MTKAILLSAVLIGSPLLAQQGAGIEIQRDIEYAAVEDHSMQLDLYRPAESTGKLPVVVWVHGGGWKNGSRANCKATWLVEHGFAVASISYRLTDVAQWPAQIDDCYSAVRFLRSHADEYQLDGDHIGVWGGSAGAHLVALMGTREYPDEEEVSSRIQAVCDWYGPSELLSMPPNNLGNGRTEEDIATSNGALLLGATVRDVPELAKDASALDNVSSDDAPFLIMHGSEDPAVPLEQSQKLHDALTAAGIDSTFIIVEGAGHGGKEFQTEENRDHVLEFFERTLKPGE